MKLDEETKEKIERLPFALKYITNYLLQAIDDLINGKCEEDKVANLAGSLKLNSEGKYSNEDLANYDEAGKMLGFGTTNRAGLKKLLDQNGIKQVKIKNNYCGFDRGEILALKDRKMREVQMRELKAKQKAYREKLKEKARTITAEEYMAKRRKD